MLKGLQQKIGSLALALGVCFSATVLPSSALTSAHQRVYLKAWESIKDNYYDRKKLSTWDNWRHQFDGRLHTRDELQKALDRMVDSLSDDYTFVLSEDDKKSRSKQQKSHAVSIAKTMDGNIGYIKLDTFSADNVVGDMKRALRSVASTDGVILDLRGNHGGFVTAAQDLFSMLADRGTFMTYDGFSDGSKDEEAFVLESNGWHVTKNGKISMEHRKQNVLGNKPLVVLVNEDTRSASEMLAGALRDNGRAVVVGKQTYGKGVLQDAYEIGEGLLMKVVTAKYYLPNGINIHEKGIEPDIELDGSAEAQLQRAAQMLSSAIAESRSTGRRVLAVIEQSAPNL